MIRRFQLSIALIALIGAVSLLAQPQNRRPLRNLIVFVADGLRHDSVSERDTPAFWRVRSQGVHFEDSYSLFPTFTTANAASIATGRLLGDTGDFSNTVWAGFALFDSGNFKLPVGTPVPFLENDQVLGDLNAHLQGNFLGQETLLAVARTAGYATAAIGKVGPTAIQDIAALGGSGTFPSRPITVIVDDATGTPGGIPLPEWARQAIENAGLAAEAPTRSNGYGPTSPFNNGFSGSRTIPGTRQANVVQQQWLIDVTTQAILPRFERDQKPFAIVFWSRDPDGTQHNHGDSLNQLAPGIDGPTSHAGVRNADRSLQQILTWLDKHPAIRRNTNVFITSDHGYATISKRELARDGRTTKSPAAQHDYLDAQGAVETALGTLPFGFLAIDLARDLEMNLFDPDRRTTPGTALPFPLVRLGPSVWEHPVLGNGLIGSSVHRSDGGDAMAIVAANGGSDLIYVPSRSAATVRAIVRLLAGYDYVGGVFVDDIYGDVPGALPFSSIGLRGTTRLPRPAIVVAFKVFYRDPASLLTAVQVSDTTLRQGQGMHGGFGRDNTYNNMAAIGPDFARRFVDRMPASNADIAPTLAAAAGLNLHGGGELAGRILQEALESRSSSSATTRTMLSQPVGGRRTLLRYRQAAGRRYPMEACFVAADDTSGVCHY